MLQRVGRGGVAAAARRTKARRAMAVQGPTKASAHARRRQAGARTARRLSDGRGASPAQQVLPPRREKVQGRHLFSFSASMRQEGR